MLRTQDFKDSLQAAEANGEQVTGVTRVEDEATFEANVSL